MCDTYLHHYLRVPNQYTDHIFLIHMRNQAAIQRRHVHPLF